MGLGEEPSGWHIIAAAVFIPTDRTAGDVPACGEGMNQNAEHHGPIDKFAKECVDAAIRPLIAQRQVTMEELAATFRDKINQLEESVPQLSAENMLLREWVLSHGGEMSALRNTLEDEETRRLQTEQKLLAVQQELASLRLQISSSWTNYSQHLPNTSAPPEVMDKNALEALTIAYDNVEKYYHASRAELEACQVHLREAEIKCRSAEKRCGELEARIERIQKDRDAKVQEMVSIKKALRSNDSALLLGRVKELEQQILESEGRHAKDTSQAAERVLLLQRRIGELECQLQVMKRPEITQLVHNSPQGQVCQFCGLNFPARMLQSDVDGHVLAHLQQQNNCQ